MPEHASSTPGRKKSPTTREVLQVVEESARPVWDAPALAEEFGTTESPVRDRLKTLAAHGEVETLTVGGTTVYYPPREPAEGPTEQYSAGDPESLRDELSNCYTHRFLGTQATWEWPATSYESVRSAETVQLLVEPSLSGWTEVSLYPLTDSLRDVIPPEEEVADRVQALITGGVVRKPTTPIEHFSYPWDTDLKAWAEECPELFTPSNDALFFTQSSIQDVSLAGEGTELFPEQNPKDSAAELDSVDQKLPESVPTGKE